MSERQGYNPEATQPGFLGRLRKKIDETPRMIKAAILAAGLHTAGAHYVEHTVDAMRADQAERKKLLVTNEAGLVAPEWSTDPQELEAEIQKIVINERGVGDAEIARKIDIGFLLIAKLQAEGEIDLEKANELREILTQKRNHYTEASKTQDPIMVLYAISQEQRRYDPRWHDFPHFLETGEGDCSAALAAFTSIVQGVYPTMELKIQYFSDTRKPLDEPHVRLIANLEGIWYSIERENIVPITLEPGSVVQDISAISLTIAKKSEMSDTKKITGEQKLVTEDVEIDPNLVAEKAKLDAETKSGFNLGHTLMKELPMQPTASFTDSTDISRPEEVAHPMQSFSVANEQLAQHNPELHAVQEKTRQKLRKKLGLNKSFEVTLINKSLEKDIDKDIKALIELSKTNKNFTERNAHLEDNDTKINTILDSIVSKKEYLTAFLKKLTQTPEGRRLLVDLRLISTLSPFFEEKRAQQTADHDTELEIFTNNALVNGMIDTDDVPVATPENILNYTLGKIKETDIEKTVEQLAAKGMHISNVDLGAVELKTLDTEWFKKIAFNSRVYSLIIRSQDTNLRFLDRPDIESIGYISIIAPVRDFSQLGEKIKKSYRVELKNISPFADLNTLPETQGDIVITNIPPTVAIPERIKKSIVLVFEESGSYTGKEKNILMSKTQKQIDSCTKIKINDRLGLRIEWAGFSDNESVTEMTINSTIDAFMGFQHISQYFGLHYFKKLKEITFEGRLPSLDTLESLSRLHPGITIYASNPDYDESDYQDEKERNSHKNVKINNGKVTYY